MEVRRALSKFVCLCALPMASVMPQDALRQRPAIAGDSPLQNHANTVQIFPNFAQTLTDEMLKEHPDVLVIAFHVQIPGESINRVVAINQAQWGKFQWRPSDDIDTDTARTRKTIVQVIPATHRMEVHMPLHTKSGETIATFVCVWNFREEEEAPELMRKSQAIRNEIAARISSVEQLLGTP